jgi:hypothetical protein
MPVEAAARAAVAAPAEVGAVGLAAAAAEKGAEVCRDPRAVLVHPVARALREVPVLPGVPDPRAAEGVAAIAISPVRPAEAIFHVRAGGAEAAATCRARPSSQWEADASPRAHPLAPSAVIAARAVIEFHNSRPATAPLGAENVHRSCLPGPAREPAEIGFLNSRPDPGKAVPGGHRNFPPAPATA